MNVIHRKGWEIPEREATPEALFLNRRTLMRGAAALGAGTILPGTSSLTLAADDPTAGLYPAKRNETYKLDRDLTPEQINSRYNNFYEFGLSKNVFMQAEGLKTRPWSLKIDGLVEKPIEISADDLIKSMPLEERLYRHRCVEAWSIPSRGPVFRCASSSNTRSPRRPRSSSASRRSWTRRWRRGSAASSRGPTSKR